MDLTVVKDTFNEIMYLFMTGCSLVLVRYVVVLANTKLAECKHSYAVKAVSDAVLKTAQTYVDEIKAHGVWDDIAKESARNKALMTALSLMTDATKNFIEKSYGDVDAWILDQIEVQCKTIKLQPGGEL